MGRMLTSVATALVTIAVLFTPVERLSAATKKLPGTSGADAVLQRDVAQQVAMIEIVYGPDCKKPRIVNTEIIEPPAIANVDKWVERWTVDRCGKTVQYRVELIPSKGGGTDYNVSLIENTETAGQTESDQVVRAAGDKDGIEASPIQLKGTLSNGIYATPDGSLRFQLPLPEASDIAITETIEPGTVSVRVSSRKLQLFYGVMKRSDVTWGSTQEYGASIKRKPMAGLTVEWVSTSLGTAQLTRFVAESPGPMLRSSEYVVIRDHAEYMAYYNLEDGESPRADPHVGAFGSLDDMLKAVFESIEIEGAKR